MRHHLLGCRQFWATRDYSEPGGRFNIFLVHSVAQRASELHPATYSNEIVKAGDNYGKLQSLSQQHAFNGFSSFILSTLVR
jgi:hypothetical protein